jgi:DNA/RNA-binding domain of Phe-tRNA-synthetase-like protein
MSNEEITFDISPEVLCCGVRGIYLVVSGLTNKITSERFETYQQGIIDQILPGLTAAGIQDDSLLKGYRDLHTVVGFSNRNFPAAPETLLENLLKYRRMARINLLVDIYNLVSLQTHLALGAHDLAFVSGNIHLKPMTGDEVYWPLGSSEPKKARPGGYSYIDDANEIICMLDSRQVEKTKVTLDTTDCFYIIQGNANTSEVSLFDCADRLINLTQTFCGGKSRILYPDNYEYESRTSANYIDMK